MELDFEKIWVAQNMFKYDVSATNGLNDSEYIDYTIWVDANLRNLYKKYKPFAILVKGKTSNVVFHGACLICASQKIYGIARCKGCSFFRPNESGKENLQIRNT